MKISYSIGPTFHNNVFDVYHKSQVSVEFDSEEDDEEEVVEMMVEKYFNLIGIEQQAVKEVRAGVVGVRVKDFMDEVRASMVEDDEDEEEEDDE